MSQLEEGCPCPPSRAGQAPPGWGGRPAPQPCRGKCRGGVPSGNAYSPEGASRRERGECWQVLEAKGLSCRVCVQDTTGRQGPREPLPPAAHLLSPAAACAAAGSLADGARFCLRDH